jgi:hypothetical protein
MRTLGSSCCSLCFVTSTRLTFKPDAGQHIRLVRTLVLVRAGEIEHRRYPPAFPVRLVAQRHPELGRIRREQPGQVLSHLLGHPLAELLPEALHIQLDLDACGLADLRVHDQAPPVAVPMSWCPAIPGLSFLISG